MRAVERELNNSALSVPLLRDDELWLNIRVKPIPVDERKRTPSPMVFVRPSAVVGVRDDIHSE